jgi:cytochrome d ubiquinol oxidase subunit I
MDVVLLSRLQFAINISFHYLFPPMSIGLGAMLVIIEGLYMKTKDPFYKQLAQFWTKIFSLFFAMGVATGFVQLFAFGNNWADYSMFVGDVFGSILAAEGIFAFFLEAGFLGLMLFGWDRVKPRTHYLSTILVTLGAHFSAIWIVIANSWMQTPQGFKVIGEGHQKRAVITNLYDVYFNPSTIDRLIHTLLGCYILGAFLFMSVGAYYLLKNKNLRVGEFSVKAGIYAGFLCLVAMLFSAHQTAEGVAKNQPIKLAAMEGVFHTQPATPISAFGYVDQEAQEVKGLKIPGLLSFLVHGDFKTPVKGLNEFPRDQWPQVQWTFQSYHLMVISWGIMMMVAASSFVTMIRGQLQKKRWVLMMLTASIILPYISNLAGWFTAEIGRQPWLVYGVLKTVDGVSRSIHSSQVASSLIMFIMIYVLLFSLFIFLLNRKIQHGPEEHDGDAIYRNPFDTTA